MIKNKIVAFVLYIVIFFALWNLLDYLVIILITRGTFEFTLFGNALIPTVVALVTGYAVVFSGDGDGKKR